MKNLPPAHLGAVLMNLSNIQLTTMKKISSYSTPNPVAQTASTMIQHDLFELASKALCELDESKNCSSLTVEVH